MRIYANYHKHDHVSNIYVPDTPIKAEAYIQRAIELGHKSYWTTNHGTCGDIFEARALCDKYNIGCYCGLEGYIVKNPLEKDKRNYHIIVIPRTNEARKQLNLITSRANVEGFYYKPRLFIDDLLALNPKDFYLTNACVAGLLKDDDSIENLLIPLIKHFGDNFFMEVQNHRHPEQIELNKKAIYYANKYGLGLIAANDSHYIYAEQSRERLEFLKGKDINYGDEDAFVLDYPDGDVMFQRFVNQGVLTDKQIGEAIDNTLIFENGCEEIYISTDIKMPTIHRGLTSEEKINVLKKEINTKFKSIIKSDGITKDKLPMYLDGIRNEMLVIEETQSINTADYFLVNEKLVDLAVNKYGGVLTRTGRGSCGGYYINRILGMTQLDRFNTGVKLYPERFMSTARLLENRSTPDIDYNVKDQVPFIKAAKELLGEHGCYPMVAYGTMQIGEAFRNVCRSKGLPFEEFNEIGKNVEQYENDTKWKPYIDEARKYVDVIVSASVHPCAFILDDKDLRKEYGVVKIGENICCLITSGEADAWKVLKDDFLIVSVWGLISETFKLIGRPIMTVKELMDNLDDKCWQLLADGITCTLNQVDSEWATSLMRRYKAKTVEEGSMFVAALRPSFDSWRDIFIDRKPYTTGSKELDEVLKSTGGMILFQENLMQYFEWLGVTPAESIGLIKKISKKKIHPEDFQKLEARLRIKWKENTGSEEHFDDTWRMIQSCMNYSFCSAHALATFTDCLYGCYLKAHYPLQYYQVALTEYMNDAERTKRLTQELDYFGIKLKNIRFGYSKAEYNADVENNTIYKGVASLKFLNADTANKLYELSQTKTYNSFLELLADFPGDSRQLDILIRLNYFDMFGTPGQLLALVEAYNKWDGRKTLSKDMDGLPTSEVMSQFATETAKQYKLTDFQGFLVYMCGSVEPKPFTLSDELNAQIEFQGYCSTKIPSKRNWAYITAVDTKYSPKITIYCLDTGVTKTVKMYKKQYQMNPVEKGMIITYGLTSKQKSRLNPETKEWQKIPGEYEDFFDWYSIREGA